MTENELLPAFARSASCQRHCPPSHGVEETSQHEHSLSSNVWRLVGPQSARAPGTPGDIETYLVLAVDEFDAFTIICDLADCCDDIPFQVLLSPRLRRICPAISAISACTQITPMLLTQIHFDSSLCSSLGIHDFTSRQTLIPPGITITVNSSEASTTFTFYYNKTSAADDSQDCCSITLQEATSSIHIITLGTEEPNNEMLPLLIAYTLLQHPGINTWYCLQPIGGNDSHIWTGLQHLRVIMSMKVSVSQCYVDRYVVKDAYRLDSQLKSAVDATVNDKTQLFLFIGQSNNSGRADLQDFQAVSEGIPEVGSYFDFDRGGLAENYKDAVVYFDPIDGWRKCTERINIHANVDLSKKTGVGPAIPFACRMVDLVSESQSNSQSEPQAAVVGIVPSSVGATFLYEWMADYFPLDDIDQPGNNTNTLRSLESIDVLLSTISSHHPPYSIDATHGCLLPPPNAAHGAGSINLQSCAMTNLYRSLCSARTNRIAGIIWYQGENDCTLDEANASTYSKRLDRFFADLHLNIQLVCQAAGNYYCRRDSSRPKCIYAPSELAIPTAVVAVTATRPFPHIATIRSHQLDFAPDPSRRSSVIIVDAFGLPLLPDSVHLTANGVFSIGIALANCLFHSLSPHSQSPDMHSQLKDLDEQFSIFVERLQIEAQDTVQSLMSRRDASMHTQYPSPPFTLADAAGGIARIRGSKLNAVNFVYGEISMTGFFSILRLLGAGKSGRRGGHEADSRTLVDLGCGAGRCLAAGYLLSSYADAGIVGSDILPPPSILSWKSPRAISQRLLPPHLYIKNIIGIDLMRSKILECTQLIQSLGFVLHSQDNDVGHFSRNHSVNQDSGGVSIDLHYANILEVDWQHCDMVVACSTCFDSELMLALVSRFLLLQPGSRIALLDKQTLSTPDLEFAFKLIASIQCHTSWGVASAFIYERV